MLGRSFAGGLALAFLLSIPAPASAATSCPPGVAHRGDTTSGHAPETVEAEVQAAQEGAPFVELDVRVSSNNVIYAFHDGTLDGLTDGAGEFALHSSKEINSLRYDNGEKIAHVADVLNALKAFPDAAIFLELKVPDSLSSWYAKLRDRIDATIGRDRVVINSYHRSYLNKYKRTDPLQLRLALDSGKALTVDYVRRYRGLISDMKWIDPAYVEQFRSAGIPVYAFSANTPEEWTSLSYVDGVFTDTYPAYSSWCQSNLGEGDPVAPPQP